MAGCGPSVGAPFTESQRQLVITESTETGERLVLVSPDGERVSFPEDLAGEVASLWGLSGTELVVSSPGGVWTWDAASDAAEELRTGPTESRTLWAAPDDRYLVIRTSGTLDVAHYGIAGVDLLDRTTLFGARGCGESLRFFAFQGEGPDAVMLDNDCVGLGEVSEYSLRRFSDGESMPMFDIDVEDPPRIRMSRAGDLLYLEYAQRWSLYNVTRGEVVHEAPLEHERTDVAWPTGSSALLRVEGKFLVRYDPDGSERFRTDLGITPIGLVASPVDSRILVRTGDCGGGSCLDIIDGEDGSDRGGSPERRIGLSQWARHGRAIIAAPVEPDGLWQYLDLESDRSRDLTPACGSPAWAPDNSAFICRESCGPEQSRAALRWFDGDGLPLFDGPCDDFGPPVWSPDSDLVAVAVGSEESGFRVWLMDRQGRSTDLGPGKIAQAGWRPGAL